MGKEKKSRLERSSPPGCRYLRLTGDRLPQQWTTTGKKTRTGGLQARGLSGDCEPMYLLPIKYISGEDGLL